MKTCHLFTTVMMDGYGDFSHLADIYEAVAKNPDLKDIEFIPVITVQGDSKKIQNKLQQIKEKLAKMGVKKFFCELQDDFEKDLHKNAELIDSLKNTDQVLFISADLVYDKCKQYINPKALLKVINEHEATVVLVVAGSKKRPLGLGDKCFGIKIGDTTPVSISQTETIVKENDPEFYNDLIKNTGTKNFQHFTEENQFVPAYFNRMEEGFYEFLSLLAAQSTQNQDLNNFAIYLSGLNLDKHHELIEKVATSFNVTIELINKNNEPVVFNKNGARTLRIFSGYYVKDNSYQALFSGAKIAGVSGDNTLESSIAHKVLPFYLSTNFKNKKNTLVALQNISQLKEIPISDEARRSFYTYFDYFHSYGETRKEKYQCNLPAMIEAWPHIADYLKKHRNYYDVLTDIILDETPLAPAYENMFNPAFKAINAMMDYGAELQKSDNSKGKKAVELGMELKSQLIDFRTGLIHKKPTEEDFQEFIKKFSKLAHSKDREMGMHSAAWKPIVANILIALTGVGIVAILAKVTTHIVGALVHKEPISINRSFFFATTKSQNLTDKINETVKSKEFHSGISGKPGLKNK